MNQCPEQHAGTAGDSPSYQMPGLWCALTSTSSSDVKPANQHHRASNEHKHNNKRHHSWPSGFSADPSATSTSYPLEHLHYRPTTAKSAGDGGFSEQLRTANRQRKPHNTQSRIDPSSSNLKKHQTSPPVRPIGASAPLALQATPIAPLLPPCGPALRPPPPPPPPPSSSSRPPGRPARPRTLGP